MSGIDDARATLLRALEQLEQAQMDLGEDGEVRHLCVVYSATKTAPDGSCHEIGGWASTADPTWLHAAMLRRAADGLEANGVTALDDDDDDGH